MNGGKFPGKSAWAGLILVIAILDIGGLGNHGLLEPDEGRYANMSMEWLEGEHDWLEPVLSDMGHYDKPPLIYWAAGSSLMAFGRSEWAVRMPSILGSILALLGVGLMAYQAKGPRAAWWSVLAAATTYQFWALSHLLSPDMLMTGLVTLGAALCLRAGKGGKGWLWWCLGAVCWLLAWYVKATAALVPLGALTIAFLVTGRKDLRSRLRPVRLLLFILLLGAPWYFVMIMRHPELEGFFFRHELIGRISGHEDGRRGIIGYHFLVAMGFWLPWWPLLVLRAKQAWPEWKSLIWRDKLRALPWEVVTALSVLLIFSFVSSKLVTYILPGVPFLALRIGIILDRLEFASFSFRQWPARIATATGVFLFFVGMVIPHLESSLGHNSSVREVSQIAREKGADLLVFDRFFPGAEYYFGESVWYVHVKDIAEVKQTKGQLAGRHFIESGEIVQRVAALESSVWLIQMTARGGSKLKNWQQAIINKSSFRDQKPVVIGDFALWKIN